MEILRSTGLKIDLEQIAANYSCLSKLSSHNFVCPMLKANAYGHGAQEVAKRLELESCKSFGVALYEEGIELRQAGVLNADILIFAPMTKSCVQLSLDHNLTPVILSDGDLEILKNEMAGQSKKLKVHLKLNFGMNRLGFNLDLAKDLIAEIRNIKNIELVGLCTHFPKSEDLMGKESSTSDQVNQFLDFCGDYEIENWHALNSGTLLGLHIQKDERIHKLGMRPGIAMYGAMPELGVEIDLPIREAMTLCTQIQHLQSVKKGEAVSYMGRWIAPEDSLIGVIPIGYADGLRRGLSGRINAKVEGQTCPQVGIICMDYVMLNLTNAKLKKPLGAKVEIKVSAQAWANILDSIPYEVMTGMGSRLPRMYK